MYASQTSVCLVSHSQEVRAAGPDGERPALHGMRPESAVQLSPEQVTARSALPLTPSPQANPSMEHRGCEVDPNVDRYGEPSLFGAL